VSYALRFTERGSADLNRLEIWLQEETLDELDKVAADPPAPNRRLAGAAVYDFVRERGQNRFYVFVTVLTDVAARELRILEIGLHVQAVA